MKRFERGCIRESAGSERDSDPANHNKNEVIRKTDAVRLRIPEKEMTAIEKTGGVTEKHASVVGSRQPTSRSNKHFVYAAVLPCQVE